MLSRSQPFHAHKRQALEEVHRGNGWCAPVAGCLDVLTKHGFVDCMLASREQARSECQLQGETGEGEGGGLFTTPAVAPRVRVDYCFARGTGIGVEGAKVLGWEGDAQALSDHLAVVFDLTISMR